VYLNCTHLHTTHFFHRSALDLWRKETRLISTLYTKRDLFRGQRCSSYIRRRSRNEIVRERNAGSCTDLSSLRQCPRKTAGERLLLTCVYVPLVGLALTVGYEGVHILLSHHYHHPTLSKMPFKPFSLKQRRRRSRSPTSHDQPPARKLPQEPLLYHLLTCFGQVMPPSSFTQFRRSTHKMILP
jgi:hypothetical protein